jgi:alpha-galactosidase
MTNVTFIGAGSAVFARQIMTDILAVEGLDAGEFRLVDIDERRLDLARRMAEKLVDISGKSWSVAASTDRRQLLEGSDFVVNTVEVAGLANVEHDYEIPLRYGVDQCIGDTIGPGGIFKALRTGPVWL